MNYKYRYVQLENGDIEPLFRGKEQRPIHQVKNTWYLWHLKRKGNEIITCHSKIVKFLTKEDIKK